MKLLDFNKIKKTMLVIVVLMIVVAVAMAMVALQVNRYNDKEHIQKIGTASNGDGLEIVDEIGDGWDKIMPSDFQYPDGFSEDSFQEHNGNGDNTSYGRTCEFKITNLSDLKIRDWKLVVPVKEDLFVNKAWNGTIEFSQFGGKNTDTFNTMKVTADTVNIDSVQVDELLMFPLMKGDIFTYYPNADFFEVPLNSSDVNSGNMVSTKIGIIFYTGDRSIDLSDAYVVYHFGKKLSDVPAFTALAFLILVLGFLLIVFALELIIGNRYRRIHQAADEKAERELGAALRAAEDANRAKTAFLNNMSHDIRTPMNAIIGFTNLIEKNIDDREKAEDYIQKIKSSNTFLMSLLNSVLEMAEIESGKTVLHDKCCKSDDFFKGVANVFIEQMCEKGISFNYKFDAEHMNVAFDVTKVREIYLNVLSNALKYTLAGGSIDFIVTEEKSDSEQTAIYKTMIVDTGIGMTEEYLSTIFDEFSRERSTTEGNVSGTGLGMHIVKKLVDLMDGAIEIRSRKGEGTEVSIILPFRTVAEGETIEIEPERVNLQNSYMGKRILLAEDNELNAEIAVALLEEAGFKVECAINGQICVDMLREHESLYYDGILMDIQMPVMNGYEAAKTIRRMEDAEKADIPILAMTANAFEEDKQEAISAGMNGHLSKPIDINKLLELLAEIL